MQFGEGEKEGREGLAVGGGHQAFLELAVASTPCPQLVGSRGQDFPSARPRVAPAVDVLQMFHPPRPYPTVIGFEPLIP